MDFLIAGIVITLIAWIALRPRFGHGLKAYNAQTDFALAELGLDINQLDPELKQMYEHDRSALRIEKGRRANPYEMACEFYLKAIMQHPKQPKGMRQPDPTLIRAIVKVSSWRNEEVGAKFADLFTLNAKLHLTGGKILLPEITGPA